MNTYHVSYAVGFPGSEYVRARRYVPEAQGLEETDIAPDYGRTDLFQTGVPHRMTVIKRGREILMHVRAGDRQEMYHWINDRLDSIEHGRVGLRQMWGKRSLYRDFRVYEAVEVSGAPR